MCTYKCECVKHILFDTLSKLLKVKRFVDVEHNMYMCVYECKCVEDIFVQHFCPVS